MLFAKETLQILASQRVDKEVNGYTVLNREVFDTSRWSTMYGMTFKYDGRYWDTYFSRGSTEMQDESPYEDEPDQIECTEVFPTEITKISFLSQEEIDAISPPPKIVQL